MGLFHYVSNQTLICIYISLVSVLTLSYITQFFSKIFASCLFVLIMAMLLKIYITISKEDITSMYNPAPFSQNYQYKVVMALPSYCDVLDLICNVAQNRGKWMPFVVNYNKDNNTLLYKLSSVKRIQRSLTVNRFKKNKTYYVYEQQIVERIFIISIGKQLTKVTIFGNVDEFYLKDFRVNLIKIYNALGILSQFAINDKCWSDNLQNINAIEGIVEDEEQIDYGEIAQDDKSDIGTNATIIKADDDYEEIKQFSLANSISSNIHHQINKEAEQPEQFKMRQIENKSDPIAQFQQELSQIQNPKHAAYLRKARAKIEEIQELMNADDWKQLGNKNGVTIYSKTMQKSIKAVKGEGDIPFSSQKINQYIHDEDEHITYDKNFARGGSVQQLPLDTSVSHQVYKGRGFVSSRDFCILSQTVKYPDGRIVVAATSCEHDDCPPNKKSVRAQCFLGGWILKPDDKDPNLTHCRYMSWFVKYLEFFKGQYSIVISELSNQGARIFDIRYSRSYDQEVRKGLINL